MDNASTAFPKPQEVLKGMSYCFNNLVGNPYRGLEIKHNSIESYTESTRKLLASLFDIEDYRSFCFTYNATQSINIVLKGLLNPGDFVIISNFEHNSVLRPLAKLAQTSRVNYKVFESDKNGIFDLNKFVTLIKKKTPRLVIWNHVSNVIGSVSPITAINNIAKKYNFLFMVDCSQSIGNLCVKGLKADFIVGTAHKSLMGPSGVGFLYVKNSDILETIFEGGGGFDSYSKEHPKYPPFKFEAGTINYIGIIGFYNGLLFFIKHYKEIIEKKKYLENQLYEKLKNIKNLSIYGNRQQNMQIPIISFNIFSIVPGFLEKILLQKYQIVTRSGLQCAPLLHKTLNTLPNGTLRVSLGFYNEEREIEYFVQSLESIIGKYASKNL